MPVLKDIDDIQVMLDDYLLRVQTMRGSPYIGAIEDDVEAWEDKLILMQDILDLWLQVEKFVECEEKYPCLLYTSPSPRDRTRSRMPSSA